MKNKNVWQCCTCMWQLTKHIFNSYLCKPGKSTWSNQKWQRFVIFDMFQQSKHDLQSRSSCQKASVVNLVLKHTLYLVQPYCKVKSISKFSWITSSDYIQAVTSTRDFFYGSWAPGKMNGCQDDFPHLVWPAECFNYKEVKSNILLTCETSCHAAVNITKTRHNTKKCVGYSYL